MSNKGTMRTAYLKDKRGTVAPVFGLMAIPMLAITGGAIDIGQAITAEKNLQNALDSASVAVCGGGTGQQTTEEILRSFLNAELANTKLNLQPPADPTQAAAAAGENDVELSNTAFDAATGSLSPTVKTRVPTTLLKLVGINEIEIEASSSVKCGAKRLELSLVLDVTGSMDNTVNGKKRIDSMKEASLDVLEIFDKNLAAGVTRIALVPFSEGVNVGSYADKVRGTIASGTSQNPGAAQYKFKKKHNQYKTYKITNCVSERVGGQAWKKIAPSCSGNNCTHPVGHVYTSNGTCRPGNEFMPLTSNKQALKTAIEAYQPNGYTAGHIGAMWGWYTLLENWGGFWPNNAPEAANEDELIKATIIMTDGEFNTQYLNGVQDRDRPGSAPNGSSNKQFEKICEAMNDDSIVVYAIGFGLSESSNTAQRLKDCATDDTKWFFPYDGDELRAAFSSIGKQLSGGQAGKAIVQQ